MSEWVSAGKVRMTPKGIHDATATYDVLDVVSNTDGTAFYIAKKSVPANTVLTNMEYWNVVIDINGIADGIEAEVDEIRETVNDNGETLLNSYSTSETSYSKMVSIEDGAEDASIKNAIIDINPYQNGNGTPSPTNICPILGWNKVTICRSSKNLVCIPNGTLPTVSGIAFTINDGVVQISGTKTSSGALNKTIGSVKLKGNTTYVISGSKSSGISDTDVLRIDLRNINGSGSSIAYGDSYNGFTFTPTRDMVALINIRIDGSQTFNNTLLYPQIEEGSTATEFSASNCYEVSFGNGVGTIYGGRLNLATGELTVNKVLFESTWGSGTDATEVGSTITKKRYLLTDEFKSNVAQSHNSICNLCTYALNSSETSHYRMMAQQVGVDIDFYFELFLPNETSGDQAVQLVYEIKHPTTHQLTLDVVDKIKTALGDNIIYADTGMIKVTYRVDPTISKTDMEDSIFGVSQEVGKLTSAIFGDKMLVFNSDGTVTWEAAPN